MREHYSDEELIDRLYGIGREDSHIEECEWCRERWLQLQERRRTVLEQPTEMPVELLAAQRTKIRERLEGRPVDGWHFHFVPLAAALSVIVLGLMLSKPAPPPPPTLASNDSGLYTEIYSMVESSEPLVAQPIDALFEE